MLNSKLRIITAGMVGSFPIGGVAWDYLQYLIGFSRMGHDVYYYENTSTWPYHPVENTYTDSGDYSAAFISFFLKQYAPDLKDRWHFHHLNNISYGMPKSKFEGIARTADLFLNISGACLFPDHLSSRCAKVFLDTDPGYNQILLNGKFEWADNLEEWCKRTKEHDLHFTYAENIKGSDCIVPHSNLDWKATRMPVVLDLWKGARTCFRDRKPWTTVMTWNAFKGKLVYKGKEYKSKGCEFEKFIILPLLVNVPFTVAIGGPNIPQEDLKRNKWNVIDGPSSTLSAGQYAEFIVRSRGEFSTAKHVYVAMKTGWFSCRSACYLASGRPVVVQDTGFSGIIPIGNGVIAFTNLDEAVKGIEAVENNYEHHCKAAYDIAGEYFSSDVVLKDLLNQVGL